MNHRRKLLTLEILPLLLTAVIAIAAAFSTYFSYKVAVIASIQENREQRQELTEWIKLLSDIIDKNENEAESTQPLPEKLSQPSHSKGPSTVHPIGSSNESTGK